MNDIAKKHLEKWVRGSMVNLMHNTDSRASEYDLTDGEVADVLSRFDLVELWSAWTDVKEFDV